MKRRKFEFEYTQKDFDFLRRLSNTHSGIIAENDKFDMFYSRLVRRIRALKLGSFKEYCDYLVENKDTEFTLFINAITTNLTSFFREKHHFEYLKDVVIPELLINNKETKTVKVWSAGCSTGEEPYSIGMILLENLPRNWKVSILGTDLDTEVLIKAKEGVYHEDLVSELSDKTLKRWFKKGAGNNADKVKIKAELRDIMHFKMLNLMEPWPIKNNFDFIFCRNVIIYFDKDTKENLVNQYSQFLEVGSHLFIGHSESLHMIKTDFNLIGKTIYRKVS